MDKDEPQVVRDGTVAADLVFLRGVLSWATRWQDEDAQYLMKENPTRGYPIPTEKNPRRPLATQERFEKIRAAAEHVTMAVGRGKMRRHERSYLVELLDLAHGSGRRISAVLALRYEDLRLAYKPRGAILWPAATDKCNKEWLVPMSGDVRDAIDRIQQERPGIGAAFLFPSVNNASKPLAVEVASAWLLEAERIAGVEKLAGTLWHAYRRKWATERKHLPDVDVAAAGGWSDTTTLKQVYQQADMARMQAVVDEPARLNEAQSS